MSKQDWTWMGHAAHFICASNCIFHMATHVGPKDAGYIVSTVGEYLPDESVRDIIAGTRGIVLQGRGDVRRADFLKKCGYEDIGCNRKYETFVFKAGPSDKCPSCAFAPVDWSEIDALGANDSGEAHANHVALCEKYDAEGIA
jgi:hypothetical protein